MVIERSKVENLCLTFDPFQLLFCCTQTLTQHCNRQTPQFLRKWVLGNLPCPPAGGTSAHLFSQPAVPLLQPS